MHEHNILKIFGEKFVCCYQVWFIHFLTTSKHNRQILYINMLHSPIFVFLQILHATCWVILACVCKCSASHFNARTAKSGNCFSIKSRASGRITTTGTLRGILFALGIFTKLSPSSVMHFSKYFSSLKAAFFCVVCKPKKNSCKHGGSLYRIHVQQAHF